LTRTLKELRFVAVYSVVLKSNTDVFETPEPEYVNPVIAQLPSIAVIVMTKSFAGDVPPPMVAASMVSVSPIW
jgi:hypothetical protein